MTPQQAPEQAGNTPVKPKLSERLKNLLAELGPIAIVVWFVLFALTWLGFIFAIRAGYRPESGTGGAGVIGIAYLATQATKPLRILATLRSRPSQHEAGGRSGATLTPGERCGTKP